MKKYALLLLAVLTNQVHGKVLYSQEADPIPIIDLSVLLPFGTENIDPKLLAAAHLLPDILEGGTEKLSREEYLGKLANYGASSEFAIGGMFSSWSLGFPYLEGKNYDELIAVLQDNWSQARLTQDNFQSAKTKLISGLQSSLDNDWGVVSALPRSLINLKDLSVKPLFLEAAQSVTIEDVKTAYSMLTKSHDLMWVGAVAPQEHKGLIQKIVGTVFKQSHFEEKFDLKALETAAVKTLPKGKKKTVVIIEKPERNQNITLLFSFRPEKLTNNEELALQFGNFILIENGLGSVWGEAMRTKGGFSYSVRPLGRSHLGYPTLGIATNPMTEKIDEAFKVMSELIKKSYVNAAIFYELPDQDWNSKFQSFKYRRQLARSTAEGRIGEISSVITGNMSPEFYKSKASQWKIDRESVQKYFIDHWNKATVTLAVMGNSKKLHDLVKANFPKFEVKTIHYKNTISEKGFRKDLGL